MREVVMQSLSNPTYNMNIRISESNDGGSSGGGGGGAGTSVRVTPYLSATTVAPIYRAPARRDALPSPFPRLTEPVNGIAICDDADLAKLGHMYELYSFTKLPCLDASGSKRGAAPLPDELCLHACYSDGEEDDDEDDEDSDASPRDGEADTQGGMALAKIQALCSAEVNMAMHSSPSALTSSAASSVSSSSAGAFSTTPLTERYTAHHVRRNRSSVTTTSANTRSSSSGSTATTTMSRSSTSYSSSYSSSSSSAQQQGQPRKPAGCRLAFWHRVPSSLPNKVITERGKTLHVSYSARAQKGKSGKHGGNVCEASELYNEGGFVIFADTLVSAHPRSAIAVVTQAYKQVSGMHNTGDVLSDLKLPEAKRYIREVQQGGRPLFRRRPSAAVYGRASYIPQPTSATRQ